MERQSEVQATEASPAAPVQAPAQSQSAVELVLALQRSAGNAAVSRALIARLQDSPIQGIYVPAAMTADRSLRHERHDGVAFVRGAGEDATGVDVSDIRQGAVGDCYFLSPLMAVARINPGLVRRLIRGPIGQTEIGADVYEVTLMVGAGGKPVTYRVDDRFVTGAAGDPQYAQYGDMSALGPELWVMLLEKAWAASKGSYQQIHFGQSADGLRALTGKESTRREIADRSDRQIMRDIRNAIDDGRPVTCSSVLTLSAAALQRAQALGVTVTAQHAYNVSWANRVNKTLDIMNPHGRNHLMGLSLADFKLFFRAYLTLDESVR